MITDCGLQIVNQTATGSFLSTHNGVETLVDSFSYPLFINLTVLSSDGSDCESSHRLFAALC